MAAAKKKAAKAKAPKAAKERKPREDTKLMQAEAMLKKGATIPDMGKELGWTGNTVRGVFARFRKDGRTITGTKHKGADTVWKMAA